LLEVIHRTAAESTLMGRIEWGTRIVAFRKTNVNVHTLRLVHFAFRRSLVGSNNYSINIGKRLPGTGKKRE
jgi:hypothetical protein